MSSARLCASAATSDDRRQPPTNEGACAPTVIVPGTKFDIGKISARSKGSWLHSVRQGHETNMTEVLRIWCKVYAMPTPEPKRTHHHLSGRVGRVHCRSCSPLLAEHIPVEEPYQPKIVPATAKLDQARPFRDN
ncbi:hypothetical protein ACJJTC_011946 [Scirpophaga incertulas]